YPPSYGAGGGLYKSTDGGANLHQLTSGLLADGVGRIGIAAAPSNRSRLYAIVDSKEGGLFRREDAGALWNTSSGGRRIGGSGGGSPGSPCATGSRRAPAARRATPRPIP